MQEGREIWWKLDCGDIGNFEITDRQLTVIKQADQAGARFVDIGEAFINIAFIRGANRFYKFVALPQPDKYKEISEKQRVRNIGRLNEIKQKVLK